MRKNQFVLGSVIVLLLVLFTGTVAQAQDATATPVPTNHVVILVVDDFSTKSISDINHDINNFLEGKQYDPSLLCYFNPIELIEGQAMADGMGGAVTDKNGTPISHGDLVLSQTLELIDHLSNTKPFTDVSITAVPVVVKNYVISEITNAIETTTSNLTAQLGTGGNHVYFVINMSFGLVPCKDYTDLVRFINAYSIAEADTTGVLPSDFPKWNAFKAALDAVNNKVMPITRDAIIASSGHCPVAQSKNLTSNPVLSSGLQVEAIQGAEPAPEVCQLQQILFQHNTISVASSGNFGFDFPTLPAAWDGVISVSGGPECDDFNFNSIGGSENRLISQRLTFLGIPLEPTPCIATTNLNKLMLAFGLTNADKVFSSSKGEIMMPGIWDYGTGLNIVQSLIASGSSQTIMDAEANTLTVDPSTGINDFTAFKTRMQAYTLKSVGVVPGTSFAAPRMSFAMAVYLAALSEIPGLTICLGTNGLIGLAYANAATVPNWDGKDYSLGDRPNIEPSICPNLYLSAVTDRLGI